MLLVPSRDGSGLVSFHTPASWRIGLLTKTAPAMPAQLVVPAVTPWQYCVVELAHELPPTLPKKPWTYDCASALVWPPVVNPLAHSGPQ